MNEFLPLLYSTNLTSVVCTNQQWGMSACMCLCAHTGVSVSSFARGCEYILIFLCVCLPVYVNCVHVWVCMCVSGYMLTEIKRASVSWLAHSHCFLSVGCFPSNTDIQLLPPISKFTNFIISVCPWDAGETWFSPKAGNKVDFHLRRFFFLFYYCCSFLFCFHIRHIHCVSMKLRAWVRVTDRQKNNLRGAYSGSQHIDSRYYINRMGLSRIHTVAIICRGWWSINLLLIAEGIFSWLGFYSFYPLWR